MPRPSVIIFDGDAGTAIQLRWSLAGLAARVRIVSDIERLTDEARRSDPDVVLLPVLTGVETTEALVQLVRTLSPAARIVITAASEAIAREHPLPAASAFLITRPSPDPSRTRAVVEAAIAVTTATAVILAVEDSMPVLRRASRALQPHGYRLMRALSAEEGIALAGEELPDLILMDINLPAMSGTDAVAALKSAEATAAIPIVMVSANDRDAMVDRALGNGAIDCIVKPFTAEALQSKVAQVVAKRDLLTFA